LIYDMGTKTYLEAIDCDSDAERELCRDSDDDNADILHPTMS